MPQVTYGGIVFTGVIDVMHDQFYPRPEKNEWGVDVLTREVRGCVPAYLEFETTLEQGAAFEFNGKTFYLQTWQQIGDPVFPGLRLTYKGLINGIPTASETRSATMQSATISAEVTSSTSTYGDIYAASKDVQYISPSSTWRYITTTQPTGAAYSDAFGSVTVLKSVITVNSIKDEQERTFTMSNTAPAAVVTALTKSALPIAVSHTSNPIYGTPYWECEDVVALLYDV